MPRTEGASDLVDVGGVDLLAISMGNTRTRALKLTGDPWAEDPGCYLDDAEIAA